MGRRDKRRSKERRLKKRMDKASSEHIGELLRREIAFDIETQPITALETGQAVHALLERYFTKGERP